MSTEQISQDDDAIRGAFGTISHHDQASPRSLKAKLLTLLAILGPGIIVMVGDNDAGGVSTYAQAGQNFGYSLLWTLPLLIPVLIVNQEMVVRLGAVTGIGYGRLIRERYGRFWGFTAVIDLFVLNFMTIVTEFIGVGLALEYFGISRYYSVPIAGVLLIAMTTSGSFRRWERFMFIFVFANFLVIPLAIMAHPSLSHVGRHLVIPGIQGGATSNSVLLIIAIVGTTVAPWQLFFQQSNIIDKKISPRWINYERADTVIGSVVTVFAATLLVASTAAAFGHGGFLGYFTDALGVANGLQAHLGYWAGAFFAIILLNASIIGAAAVTLSTVYAFGDLGKTRLSLNMKIREAKGFYGGFVALVLVAVAVVLTPGAPLGVIVTAVQALAGLLLPLATVFLLLLCNDTDVLGPWVNRGRLNALATAIVSVLVVLSLILMTTTVFPHVNVVALSLWLGVGLSALLVVVGLVWVLKRGASAPKVSFEIRSSWRMPQAVLLDRPALRGWRRYVLGGLFAYLVLSVLLLVVKVIQLTH